MLVIASSIVFTLSVCLSNAQDPQTSWQMPQYQAGGLPFSPGLKEFPRQQEERTPVRTSGSQRCVVEQHERIECGEPDLTPEECEDISCCHDARGCYYAKAVTLQCTRDGQFVLVVARDATLPHISLDSIHMLENDPNGSCAPVSSTATFAIYQFAVSSCGTRMKDMYTSYYSEEDYPVTKVLREPVYVEVRILERTDPNVILVLDHCWSTSTPEPLSLPQWDLVLKGCPYKDDHYLTTPLPVGSSGLQYPSHYKRFVVKMFTFVDQSSFVPLQERIFIHCTTSVCHRSATEPCEPSCGSRKRRAVSEDLKDSKEKVVVSSGEVIIVSHLPVSDNLVSKEVPQILDYGLWVAGALTAFGVCGLVMAVIIQRTRPRPQPAPV